jgi:outer membrane protein assembly factor BamB
MLTPALALLLILATPVTPGADWPKWLGPSGDGISTETALAKPWPASGLKKVWSAPVGLGYASPVAVDGRVYVFHDRDGREQVTAFDAATGAVVWNQWDEGGWHGQFPGTRATPSIDGRLLFTYGGEGDLTARMQSNGMPLWRVNVLKAAGSTPLTWGVASSPLVDGDTVYVQTGVGGSVAVAVNKKTGAILWKSETRGTAGYAAPILAKVDGTNQLIVAAAQQIVGLAPDSGKQLWTAPFHIEIDVNATTPVFRDGALFVSAAYNGGAMQLKVGPTGASPIWTTKQVQSRFNAAIFDGGSLYVNSEGTVKCVDWRTGEIQWSADAPDLRLGVGGSVVRVGQSLLTLSERGTLTLLEAKPSGYKKMSQFEVTKGSTVWATPLLYRNRIYVRGEKEITAWEIP